MSIRNKMEKKSLEKISQIKKKIIKFVIKKKEKRGKKRQDNFSFQEGKTKFCVEWTPPPPPGTLSIKPFRALNKKGGSP